jgi:hypothetical protein
MVKHFLDAVEVANKSDGRNYIAEFLQAVKPCFERGSLCQLALVAGFRLFLAYLSGLHGDTTAGGDTSGASEHVVPSQDLTQQH